MILDERAVVARIERLSLRELRLWVREGWVRPAQGERGALFDELDVARLRLLCDFRKEMAVPQNMMPMVLSLIDNLHQTRRDLMLLAAALDEQPTQLRQTVLAAVKRQAEQDK